MFLKEEKTCYKMVYYTWKTDFSKSRGGFIPSQPSCATYQ